MAVAITKRTLCGFNTAQVNAQYYPDLIQCLTHSSQTVVSNLRDAKGFWGLNDKKEMKIDAILRSGRLERWVLGKMQSGAAEKWGEVTKKRASRLGRSGAKEIDEADFAVVLVGDRIALAPIAQ